MREMTIAALFVCFPALVVIVLSVFLEFSWFLPAVASTLFTAFPFVIAILWLRNIHRKKEADRSRAG